MDSNDQQVIKAKVEQIVIHPFAQPAYECDLDLRRQCIQHSAALSLSSPFPFEYPKVVNIDGGFQVISGWSQLLYPSTDMPEVLQVVCISHANDDEVSDIAWQYLIARLLNQIDHATFCAQLSQVLERSSLSHTDIEALTGVSARTLFAIARKLSQTSLSTSKRQISRLEQSTDEGVWL
ncbi:hypothetical protein [Idiomarina aminovorans]|uniref:hypothetical protein n=1 Tax=Idiomarina aminovorans TaxID=2914829 RepID=UPI002005D870|nr:hypothetical protein [Idiomarina sp. ATCH4]MCK7460208.1 hypothetical protein [Idiomarina sp. ATCH4]